MEGGWVGWLVRVCVRCGNACMMVCVKRECRGVERPPPGSDRRLVETDASMCHADVLEAVAVV